MFFEKIQTYLPALLQGAIVTVELFLAGAALALVMALVAGVTNLSRWLPVRTVSRTYIEVFRGTSEIIQLFWVFYALPILLGISIRPFVAGVVVLGLNLGAYGSEVVRGAILAVPKEQYEGATALNFTSLQRMRRVVLPQAFVAMVPPFSNLSIQLLKSTALVSAITLTEMTRTASLIRSRTGDSLILYSSILVIYFILAQIVAFFMRGVERRARARVGRAEPRYRLVSRLPPRGVDT